MGFEPDLIFDLGLFEGQDSRFYLDKGFRVVGVEANPSLIELASLTFDAEISDGRLTLIDRAIWTVDDREMPFHVHGEQSSLLRDHAESYGASITISVKTIRLKTLVERFGVPYYLKCDIEGADQAALTDLYELPVKPAFLSVEGNSVSLLDQLAKLGYDRFQIVNQHYNWKTKAPVPAREGRYVPANFKQSATGLFGKELERSFWVDRVGAAQILDLRHRLVSGAVGSFKRYALRKYGKLTGRHWLITLGWTDIHACHASALDGKRLP